MTALWPPSLWWAFHQRGKLSKQIPRRLPPLVSMAACVCGTLLHACKHTCITSTAKTVAQLVPHKHTHTPAGDLLTAEWHQSVSQHSYAAAAYLRRLGSSRHGGFSAPTLRWRDTWSVRQPGASLAPPSSSVLRSPWFRSHLLCTSRAGYCGGALRHARSLWLYVCVSVCVSESVCLCSFVCMVSEVRVEGAWSRLLFPRLSAHSRSI